jgi:hypothetical protein
VRQLAAVCLGVSILSPFHAAFGAEQAEYRTAAARQKQIMMMQAIDPAHGAGQASAPNPKFAPLCSTSESELRIRRALGNP